MGHYDPEREKQYEEDKLNEASKDATVIDCTGESNDKELPETVSSEEFYRIWNDQNIERIIKLEKELKKQIEENALLYKENAKLRRWKESVINLISEKVGE